MKPKNYWYGIVKKQIGISKAEGKGSLQSLIIENAITEANRETKKLPNGDLRLQAVKGILIDRTSNYEGMALQVNYSERTIRKWINSYVNLVGKKAGY